MAIGGSSADAIEKPTSSSLELRNWLELVELGFLKTFRLFEPFFGNLRRITLIDL